MTLIAGAAFSIRAIETPGGDDDRQWLTFWLILTILLFVERFLARVILSSMPMYYEIKLALLCWLMLAGGADTVYRKLRRFLGPPRLRRHDNQSRVRLAQEDVESHAVCSSQSRCVLPKPSAHRECGSLQGVRGMCPRVAFSAPHLSSPLPQAIPPRRACRRCMSDAFA